MQFALDQHQQLVNVCQAITGEPYYCVKCHRLLHIKKSVNGRPYYAHLSFRMQSGQTPEHLLGKRQIFEWADDLGWHPQLEYYLSAIEQRADIYLSIKNQAVAIEFQCSPLTMRQIKQRNAGYRSQNIVVRWLLGSPYERRLNSAKIAQFTQNCRGQFAVPFWSIERRRIVYHYFYRTSFSQLRGNQAKLVQLQCMALQGQGVKHPDLHFLRTRAYQQFHILSCCPFYAHDLTPHWPLFYGNEMEWRIAVLLKLERMTVGTRLSKEEWQALLIREGSWLEFPCLTFTQIRQVHYQRIQEFTSQLLAAGIIKKDFQKIIYVQTPKWFSSLDQKLRLIHQGISKD